MPYNDGILYSEMTDFQKELMQQANNIFPKEYEKFLKKEGGKLSQIQKKIAQKEVGEDESNDEIIVQKNINLKTGKTYTKIIKKDYHACFKRGKIYEVNGSKCIRAYNSSRHGHLIEYGHKKWIRGKDTGEFVSGKLVIKKAEQEFKDEFQKDAEKFLYDHFSNFKGSRV